MGLRVLIAHSLAALVRSAREETGALIVTEFWGVTETSLGQPDRRIVGRLGGIAPTVVMTGRVWASDETTESLGIIRLLPKPFDVDDLEEAVHACMRQDTETEQA